MSPGSGASETRASPPSSPSRPAQGFAPGTLLADRYRIVSLAGRGGMGEVYRADDLKLGQMVALKFLPAALERDPAARERLFAEVRNARTVSHPNVCRVYDIGEMDGPALSEPSGSRESKGRAFLTMEYIDGEDLASLLRRIGRLPAPKALDIARQLCAGLASAHDKGVLHRDLKPANVMIDGRGQARITDFGLAVERGHDEPPADAAGTLAYMAPERFDGVPATVQSDLYALGLVLYEACTGHAPFAADTVDAWARAHRDLAPAAPSSHAGDLEPAVERAILRCLEKEPAKRPASAALVAAALPGGDPLAAVIAAGETPSPELVAASGEEGTLPRARAWLWLLACLGALAIVPVTLIPFSLAEHVPMNLSPDALQARARDTLEALGHSGMPVDSAWWFRADEDQLDRLNRLRPSEALAKLRTAQPGPVVFCYRQSPAALTPLGFGGRVSAADPPPQAGDAYLEADLRGRLLALRVTPPLSGAAPPLPDAPVPARALPAVYVALNVAFWVALAVMALFARRNLRLGRCDRAAARTLALAVVVVWTAHRTLAVHSPLAGLDLFNEAGLLAQPLLLGLFAWVAYLGGEPYFRRAWPHLLIASTRLLEGRWRDALVGRAVLAGVLVGTIFALPASVATLRALDLAGGGPSVFLPAMFARGPSFVASRVMWLALAAIETALWLTVLFVARLASRRTGVAWAVFAALMVGFGFLGLQSVRPASVNPLLLLPFASFFWLLLAWLLWKYGALALAVAFLVSTLVGDGPWTMDVSRWYAWRGALVLAAVATLAVWGFLNVLGRQSAFPAGALDR